MTLGRLRQDRGYAAWFSGFLLLLALLLPAMPVLGDDQGWSAAEDPGAIILMRHALAPGTGDPAAFDLSDCATQRNLSDEGRDQARRIGEAFETHGIDVASVLTSQWCRCRETAERLGLAAVEEVPALNSFFRDRSTADAQTQDVLGILGDLPPDERVILVTHQVNITALTGVFPTSGEALVVGLVPGDERLEVRGRILIEP